jgi:hypothetical protein
MPRMKALRFQAMEAGALRSLLSVLLIAPPIVLVGGAYAFGQDAYEAFYGSFANRLCCWTNKCCYEIDASEIEDLGTGEAEHGYFKGQTASGHAYRIKASGQIIVRTDSSPDGKYHRCSCDWTGSGWKMWPGANTRCLFTPSFGS